MIISLVLIAGLLAAVGVLAVALWKLITVVRILVAIVIHQAGIPTQDQRDEIARQLARLG